MVRRKIDSVTGGTRAAKVYRISGTDEYVVTFYENNVKNKEADYFTNDWSDAIDTAKLWVKPSAQPVRRVVLSEVCALSSPDLTPCQAITDGSLYFIGGSLPLRIDPNNTFKLPISGNMIALVDRHQPRGVVAWVPDDVQNQLESIQLGQRLIGQAAMLRLFGAPAIDALSLATSAHWGNKPRAVIAEFLALAEQRYTGLFAQLNQLIKDASI